MHHGVAIGRVSEMSGVKVPTIRYYEGIGLLPPPPRSEGNQRRYDASARDRLRFIVHARAMGFPMPSLRAMLQIAGHRHGTVGECRVIEVLSDHEQCGCEH